MQFSRSGQGSAEPEVSAVTDEPGERIFLDDRRRVRSWLASAATPASISLRDIVIPILIPAPPQQQAGLVSRDRQVPVAHPSVRRQRF